MKYTFFDVQSLGLFGRAKRRGIAHFTLPYQIWSSIVIVHGKNGFFATFFRNISKTAETILIKKIWMKLWHFGLQKSSIK